MNIPFLFLFISECVCERNARLGDWEKGGKVVLWLSRGCLTLFLCSSVWVLLTSLSCFILREKSKILGELIEFPILQLLISGIIFIDNIMRDKALNMPSNIMHHIYKRYSPH